MKKIHLLLILRLINVQFLLAQDSLQHNFIKIEDPVIVNAFEKNSNINLIPAAISILTKSSLERFNGTSFVQSINTIPGVKMDERSPGSYRLSIRGNLLRSTFGVRNVKVYWNGLPFTDASGNTYFNELAVNDFNRVEILKGPAGSMYGAGTGGVVLLGNNLTESTGKSISAQVGGGSYGMFNAGAAFTDVGQSRYSLSFNHQQADGYRDQSAMRRDVGNFTGKFFINQKQRISANIFYSDLYYQTPGGLTQAELSANPHQSRPAAGALPSAAKQKAAIYLKTIYAGASHEYKFSDKWVNTTGIYGSYTDFRNPTIRNYEDKYEKGIGGRTVLQYNGKIFTHTFGGEYQSGFINTGVYGNRQGKKDTLQYNDEIKSRQYNLFAQTDINVSKRITFTAGLSYNNFHYGFDRINLPVATTDKSDFTPQLAPRVAAIFNAANLHLYAAVSKGYSPPGIDEVHASDGNFNSGLKAETGVNYEVGLKGDIIKRKLSIDGSYYIFGLRNTIVSRRDSSGADYYVNAGKTKQRGLEVSVNFIALDDRSQFMSLLKTWISYTHIHARFKNYQQGTADYDGNKLTGTPPDVIVAGIDIETQANIYATVTYSYTGRIPLNDANTFYSNAYNILFVKAGYKISFGKKGDGGFWIAYQNSFNTPYSLGNDLNAAGNRFYNPSAPNDITIGIKINHKF